MKTKNKSFKRLFAFLVALVMVTALVPSVVIAAGTFPDVDPNGWAYEHIESLYAQGIIDGFPDGEFKPDENLTRQQAAKMIALSAGYEDHDGAGSKLVDVANLSWGKEYIWALEADGVVKGFGTSNEFRPRINITRGHVAKMVALAFGLEEGDEEYELTDIVGVDNEEYIRLLASNGIVNGYRNSTEFRPDRLISRGEFSKIIDLAMKWEPAPIPFEVLSVKAINATEIQVTFSKPVNDSSADPDDENYGSALNPYNYALTWNTGRWGDPVLWSFDKDIRDVLDPDAPITLSEGNTVATLKLRGPSGEYHFGYRYLDSGDLYSVDVSDGILSADGERLERYSEKQKPFLDYEAPKLLSVEVDKDDYLVLTFNEPVFAKGYGIQRPFAVTVEGQRVDMVNQPIKPLDYTVKSALPLDDDLLEVGAYKVQVFNARDFVYNNGAGGNLAPVLYGEYQIDPEIVEPDPEPTKPYVVSVTAVDFVTFNVNFDQPVVGAKILAKMGNTVFFNETRNSGVGNSIKVELPLTVSHALAITSLYDVGADSTLVDVKVTDFAGTFGGIVGDDTENQVTLERDSKLPAAAGDAYNDIDATSLVVKLNRNIDLLNKTKISVVDKNNVSRTINDITFSADVVNITLINIGNKDLMKAHEPFKVVFEEGAISSYTDFVRVESDIAQIGDGGFIVGEKTNTLKNVEFFTTVVAKPDPVVPDPFPPIFDMSEEVVFSVERVDNVITVVYRSTMDANAALLSNYSLDYAAFPAGTKITMGGLNRVVTITLPEMRFDKDQSLWFEISTNVKTAEGTYVVGNIATKLPYGKLMDFHANIPAELTGAKFLIGVTNDDLADQIEVTFNEALDGTPVPSKFIVTVHGSDVPVLVTAVTLAADGKSAILELDTAVHTNYPPVKVTVLPGSGLGHTPGNVLWVELAEGEVTVEGEKYTPEGALYKAVKDAIGDGVEGATAESLVQIVQRVLGDDYTVVLLGVGSQPNYEDLEITEDGVSIEITASYEAITDGWLIKLV